MINGALDSLSKYVSEIGEDFTEVVADFKENKQLKLKNLLPNKSLEKNMSLLEFLPYRTFDAKNSIFENKQTLGFILRLDHFSGMNESAKSALQNIINNDLPSGCTLQVINYASPKIGHLLDYWQKSGSQEEIFKKFSSKRAEFFAQGSFTSLLGRRANLIIRDFELYFIFSMAKSNSEHGNQEIIFTLQSLQEKFTQFLKEVNSDASILNDRDLANLLQEMLCY